MFSAHYYNIYTGKSGMTLRVLITRYALFALIATFLNLAIQRFILSMGSSEFVFVFALIVGTLLGLVVKYVLDKRWIFQDLAVGFSQNTLLFSRYTLMGLASTALFWITEATFWITWKTEAMRELGAILGLSFGYLLKYHLDRHFVFTNTKLRGSK